MINLREASPELLVAIINVSILSIRIVHCNDRFRCSRELAAKRVYGYLLDKDSMVLPTLLFAVQLVLRQAYVPQRKNQHQWRIGIHPARHQLRI